MKRLGLGIGLFLLISVCSALPAEACMECVYAGQACSEAFGCVQVYRCQWTNTLCSECWESCRETTDEGCIVAYWCQWTSLAPQKDPNLSPVPRTTVAP
jgi:hypothetical protein